MIPKIIHYCWFGGNPLDDLALKCIDSWKKFFPDYEITQWNESNFDVSEITFMKEAYDRKKWAFVSDVARLLVIYRHGGIYFDTDVEVVQDFSDILQESPEGFLGYEKTNAVSSGLGFGAAAGNPFIGQLINAYQKLNFSDYTENLSEIACPILTTRLMEQNGYVLKDEMQIYDGLRIYPSDYFSPIDYASGKLIRTSNTHSIHWYSASWSTAEEKKNLARAQKLRRIFGNHLGNLVFDVSNCIRNEGLIPYIRRHI